MIKSCTSAYGAEKLFVLFFVENCCTVDMAAKFLSFFETISK
jgi:hypothetical protein